MIDEQELRKKIQEMESDALIIESEIEHFFISIDKKKPRIQQQPSSLFPPSSSFSDYERFETISGDFAEYHRYLIRRYEIWYNQAHMLIQNHYKDKEVDFVRLHDGLREPYTGPAFKTGAGSVTKNITAIYGISELLQFDASIRYLVRSSDEIVQKITGLFSKQRAILLALPGGLPFCENKTEKFSRISEKTEISPFSSQTINITQFAPQNIDNSIKIQNFADVFKFIESNADDNQKKTRLLDQVKKMESNQNKKEYLNYYQEFIATLSDTITVFTPVLTFLSQYMPK